MADNRINLAFPFLLGVLCDFYYVHLHCGHHRAQRIPLSLIVLMYVLNKHPDFMNLYKFISFVMVIIRHYFNLTSQLTEERPSIAFNESHLGSKTHILLCKTLLNIIHINTIILFLISSACHTTTTTTTKNTSFLLGNMQDPKFRHSLVWLDFIYLGE